MRSAIAAEHFDRPGHVADLVLSGHSIDTDVEPVVGDFAHLARHARNGPFDGAADHEAQHNGHDTGQSDRPDKRCREQVPLRAILGAQSPLLGPCFGTHFGNAGPDRIGQGLGLVHFGTHGQCRFREGPKALGIGGAQIEKLLSGRRRQVTRGNLIVEFGNPGGETVDILLTDPEDEIFLVPPQHEHFDHERIEIGASFDFGIQHVLDTMDGIAQGALIAQVLAEPQLHHLRRDGGHMGQRRLDHPAKIGIRTHGTIEPVQHLKPGVERIERFLRRLLDQLRNGRHDAVDFGAVNRQTVEVTCLVLFGAGDCLDGGLLNEENTDNHHHGGKRHNGNRQNTGAELQMRKSGNRLNMHECVLQPKHPRVLAQMLY